MYLVHVLELFPLGYVIKYCIMKQIHTKNNYTFRLRFLFYILLNCLLISFVSTRNKNHRLSYSVEACFKRIWDVLIYKSSSWLVNCVNYFLGRSDITTTLQPPSPPRHFSAAVLFPLSFFSPPLPPTWFLSIGRPRRCGAKMKGRTSRMEKKHRIPAVQPPLRVGP